MNGNFQKAKSDCKEAVDRPSEYADRINSASLEKETQPVSLQQFFRLGISPHAGVFIRYFHVVPLQREQFSQIFRQPLRLDQR